MEPTVARIAFIDHHFPYIGTFVVSDILRLEARGVDIVVFPLKRYHGEVQDEYRQMRSPVMHIPYVLSARIWRAIGRFSWRCPRRLVRALWRTVRPNLHSFEWLWKTLAIVPKALAMAAEIEDRGIHHLHATWAHFPTTAAYLIAELVGCTYSFNAHAGMDIYRNQTMLPEKIAGARFVITCTARSRDFLKRMVGDQLATRIQVIYHGIDLHKFAGERLPASPVPLLLSVGSLIPSKGFIHMIEAVALLRNEGLSFQYCIVGKGPEEARLRQAIAEHALEGVVDLRGERTHAEVIQLLRQANVFVLPCVVFGQGEVDGIPNALVEALAMQVPVVSTRLPTISELICDGESGCLVTPGDAAGLAKAIGCLLEDERLCTRLAAAGAKRVLSDFDVEKNFLRTFALFEPLLGTTEE